jgi:hypothetical protein
VAFDDKLYIEWPGGREVQIFPTDRDTFTIRIMPRVGIAFERRAEGQVTAMTVTLGKRELRAVRAQQP